MFPRCILFDIDGVLVQGQQFSTMYSEAYNVPYAKIIPFFAQNGPFKDCLIGEKDIKQELLPFLLDWGWTQGVDAFLTYRCETSTINQGLITLVKELQKNEVFCYVATNQEKHRSSFLWHERGLHAVFDGIFSSRELRYKKPDRAFFIAIHKQLKEKHTVSPEEIFFLDDTEDNVLVAKSLGFTGLVYTSNDDFVDALTTMSN